MKTTDEKSKFLELRIQGYSLSKISKELGISKTTLVKWNDNFYQEIANAKYDEMQTILDNYQISTKEKVQTVSRKLKEVYETIEGIDLTELPLKEILLLKENLEKELAKVKEDLKYYTGETLIPEIEYLMPTPETFDLE